MKKDFSEGDDSIETRKSDKSRNMAKTTVAKSTGKTVVSLKTTKKSDKPLKGEEEILLQALRGMRDILPDEQPYWERVRRVLTHAQQEYGFQRIDLPMVEFSHLYLRTIGEGTDIVDKEIYTFTTRGGDKVALRPEMTA